MKISVGRRPGFTLVELMVAAALTILIMAVVTVAFRAGLETLSHLRSMGELAEKLRVAQDRLRSDLDSEHFSRGSSSGPLRLSDLRYERLSNGGYEMVPPTGGFFMLRQGTTGSTYEGNEADGFPSTRSTNHVLGMAVYRAGKNPSDLFSVDVGTLAPSSLVLGQLLAQSVTDAIPGSGIMASNWAEVYWFLGNPQTVGTNTVFTLYRRVRLMTKTAVSMDSTDAAKLTGILSIRQTGPSTFETNTPESIRNPANRLYATPTQLPSTLALPSSGSPSSQYYGDDVVLTGVVSFEVKAAYTTGADSGVTTAVSASFRRARTRINHPILAPYIDRPLPLDEYVPLPAGQPQGFINHDYPFDDLPPVSPATHPTGSPYLGQLYFDTWHLNPEFNHFAAPTPATLNSMPNPIRVSAVQVKFRVFEGKNNMTRQATITVKL